MINKYRRIAIVGSTACGKTTLGAEISRRLEVQQTELDELRFLPNWDVVSERDFRDNVVAIVGTESWVIDGNYEAVRDIIWLRADLLVWIDFSLPSVLWRLVWRTLARLLKRETFANGNLELLNRIFGKKSIFLWTIRSHDHRRRNYEELLLRSRYSHLCVVRLRTQSAIDAWLADIPIPKTTVIYKETEK